MTTSSVVTRDRSVAVPVRSDAVQPQELVASGVGAAPCRRFAEPPSRLMVSAPSPELVEGPRRGCLGRATPMLRYRRTTACLAPLQLSRRALWRVRLPSPCWLLYKPVRFRHTPMHYRPSRQQGPAVRVECAHELAAIDWLPIDERPHRRGRAETSYPSTTNQEPATTRSPGRSSAVPSPQTRRISPRNIGYPHPQKRKNRSNAIASRISLHLPPLAKRRRRGIPCTEQSIACHHHGLVSGKCSARHHFLLVLARHPPRASIGSVHDCERVPHREGVGQLEAAVWARGLAASPTPRSDCYPHTANYRCHPRNGFSRPPPAQARAFRRDEWPRYSPMRWNSRLRAG